MQWEAYYEKVKEHLKGTCFCQVLLSIKVDCLEALTIPQDEEEETMPEIVVVQKG